MAACKEVECPNSECMELTLVFHRTSDGSSRTAKLLLPPSTKTVAEAKSRIQAEYSIPVCQQRLALNGHTLEDSQTVAQLYIRHQDALAVTYYGEANVKFLAEFLGGSLKPLVARLQASPELVAQPWQDIGSESQELITQCKDRFHLVTYISLLKWESTGAEANRQFIVQEGGVDATLQLYALLQGVPWERRSSHMQSLEVICLSFLWNFGETAYARRLVLEGGGFNMMVKSLLVYGDEEFLQKYCIHEVFDSAVGALSNYSEVESCQLPLVQNTRAMNRLLHFAIHGAALNFYTKMLIANCLLRLSHNLGTHTYLAHPDLLGKILEFHGSYQQAYAPSQLIRYSICLALARMVLYSYSCIPEELGARVLQAVRDSQLPVPSDLTTMVEKFQYNWITVVPLVESAFVPLIPEGGENAPERLMKACYHECLDVAVTALEVEMGRQRNRRLALQQGLLEYIVCLPWGVPRVEWKDRLKTIVSRFQRELKALPVPRLSTITMAMLARTRRDFSVEFRKHL